MKSSSILVSIFISLALIPNVFGQVNTFNISPKQKVTDKSGRKENCIVVKIFYATDRKATREDEASRYYGLERNDDGQLSFGTCEVSIPRNHNSVEHNPPKWNWRLEYLPKADKVVKLQKTTQKSKDEYFNELSGCIGLSNREALIFIHGFRETFESAAKEAAELSYDLGFEGITILYSWPSRGNLLGYAADEASIEWTAPHLREFLRQFMTVSQIDSVHLIAHSMGNRALINVLSSFACEQGRITRQSIQQVILAAPDIDVGVFSQIASTILPTAGHITLYASSKDKALFASRKLHHYQRLGDTNGGVTIISGIDTIDVSAVGSDIWGHSYFIDSESVIADISGILLEKKTPEISLIGKYCRDKRKTNPITTMLIR